MPPRTDPKADRQLRRLPADRTRHVLNQEPLRTRKTIDFAGEIAQSVEPEAIRQPVNRDAAVARSRAVAAALDRRRPDVDGVAEVGEAGRNLAGVVARAAGLGRLLAGGHVPGIDTG